MSGLAAFSARRMRRELHRIRRIGLVEHDWHVALLRDLARGLDQILRELLIGGEQRHRLAAGLLSRGRERPTPRLSAGPHGALLNHMSWWTLLFTWNEKLPDQQHAALLDQRHDRRGRHRRVGREQQIDLVDVEQLRVERRRLRGARLVVIDHEFDLAAEQPALGVDVVAPDLVTEQRGLAAAGEPAGLRHRHADLDRRLIGAGSRNQRDANAGDGPAEKRSAFHCSSLG